MRKLSMMLGGGLLLLVAATVWLAGARGTDERTAPASGSPQVRELRLGLNIAAGSALHAAALHFAEQVEARSQGSLKVSVFPDQQLGNDDQMLEMARSGSLDLVLIPTAKLSSSVPAMQYADLPFFFRSRDELYAMLDGEPGAMLLAKLNAIDLVGLTFWENGFKQFTANVPLHSPQDFQGLRIRTMKSPLIAAQFTTLGAQPIPIDFHAIRQALADGAVDGQENPLVAIVAMGLHDVQKHLTLSNHAYLGYVFSASKRVFATLSPEQRELIQVVARELTVWERQETARREAAFIEQIRNAGVTIHVLSEEERARFAQVLSPIADQFGFQVGYDLLAKTGELQIAQRGLISEDPVFIGLNADLSAGGAMAGGAIYRGVQLAVEGINQQGGVLGRPLRILARDHGANPQIGRQNLEWFARHPGVVAVVGGMHSAVITEELPDIHRLGIPYLIPWAAARGLTQHDYRPNYTFRVSVDDSQVVPFLLEHAQRQGGRVVVVLERSAWGRSTEAVLRPLFERMAGPRPELIWVEAGDAQLETRVASMVHDDTGALIMVTNAPEARAIVRGMAALPRRVPILAHWGLAGGDFFVQMQTELQKVDLRLVQSILAEDAGHRHPLLSHFLKRYRLRYGLTSDAPIPGLIGSVHSYDLTQLLARAIQQARSTERAAIRASLEHLPSYVGVLREYHPAFSPARHDALDRNLLHMGRFNARGQIVEAP